MGRAQNLDDELEFLSEFLVHRGSHYRQANWLRSSYHAPHWLCVFGDSRRFEIDFDVRLEDGSLLTAPKNQTLLDTIKSWLCVQTAVNSTGGQIYAPNTEYNKIRLAIKVIDYFLLNARRFGLAKHGLQCLTENDLTELLSELAHSNEAAYSVYRWPEMLTAFLRRKILAFTSAELNSILIAYPAIAADIPNTEDCMLDLSKDELIRARAWLYHSGHYSPSDEGKGYRLSPSTELLALQIYSNTLGGKNKKPLPLELMLEPGDRIDREFPCVPVRTNLQERLSVREWSRYKGVLESLGVLSEIGIPVPISALQAIDNKMLDQVLMLKDTGRFSTVPQHVVLHTLGRALEFALEYGEDIVESCLAVMSAAKMAKQSCVTFGAENDIGALITPKLASIGVKVWQLAFHVTYIERRTFSNSKARLDGCRFYRRFRANEGLWELVRVLYGSIQIIVGALMARRQGELRDLLPGKCLDKTGAYLIFHNRKSGTAGLQDKEKRPIPPVAANLIKLLERFHERLRALKISTPKTTLFSFPTVHGKSTCSLTSPVYNETLDIFSDYMETPLNQSGERYYLRQHQLRRFFAMLFFWGGSFGGLDTLRWFLGHTDVEHLYHYITESVPGSVLRAIQASCAADLAKAGLTEANALCRLVEAHFHTSDFSVLDSKEMEEYIEELIMDGRVTIQPEFIDTPQGKSHRILIRVTNDEISL